jgi:hypothetical protein
MSSGLRLKKCGLKLTSLWSMPMARPRARKLRSAVFLMAKFQPFSALTLIDAGMCGPVNSIIGRAVEPIVQRFVSNLPAQFPVASGEVRLRGALVEIDEASGRALRISRIDEAAASNAGESESEAALENEYKEEQENG